MAKKKEQEKKSTTEKKKRGRKKKDSNADLLINEDDALENITGDEDYINLQSSGVVVEEGKKSSREQATEEEEPIFEEDIEEQAVKEVISGKVQEYELDADTIPKYDELTESDFKVGDPVVHPKYGEGVVLGQFGEGDFLKVYIHFEKSAAHQSKIRLFLVKQSGLKKQEKKKSKKGK